MTDTTDISTTDATDTSVDNIIVHHIIDCSTGQITIIDDSEKHATMMEEIAKQNAKMETERVARQATRDALLAKLGITSDEAQLLLG